MTLHKSMAAQSNITVRQLYRMLALTSTLRFPRYPCYYFPAFLLIELYRKCRHRGYRLLPAPKKFIDTLTRNELLKSDHYCIISEAVYDTLVPAKDLNWINVIFSDAKDGSERGPSSARNGEISKDNIVQTILNKPNSSILLPAISFPNCPSHCVFVSENCYENFCTKYKLNDDRQLCPIHVRLKPIGRDQTLPRMASRATIFLLRNAYDLSFDATDEILHQYFRQPRILYRNHTYDIPLDELVLDSQLRAKYLSTFNDLRRIYFRCLHLESADNPFEIMAVVVKGTTTLHQTTSINYPIPRQCLDDYCCLPQLPWGLQLAFDELKTSLLPFIDDMYPSAVQKQATNATNEPSATVNKSKMLPHRIHPLFLIQGDAGTGRKQLVNAVARSLGLQQYKIRCSEIVSTVAAQTEAKLKAALARADTCEPLLVSLELFDVFGVDHEGRGDPRLLALFQNEIGQLFARQRRYPLIIIAMTSKKTINPLLQRQFLDVIRIAAPNEQQRYAHFHWLFNREIILQEIFNRKSIENVPLFNGGRMEAANACLARHFSPAKNVQLFHTIAEKTKGFVYGDIKLLFDNCIKKMMLNNRWMADGFDLIEIERCLTGMQKEFSASLGAPKVPKVLWSDIGGLAKLKDEIQSSIGLPLKHMHLMGKNMRRSGILLYGPPGTGKTLVAKAVATECNLSFLSVQGPELLNMYVGQSEQNVREVFERARSAAPCVIFLDELDSLAPNRGHSGDSGGVMDRVVSQLLAEMDGMASNGEPQKQIFILAATNRPDLIDPALLRPGRFDKLLYVGPCKTIDDKEAVLKAQMQRFKLHKSVTIESIAKLLVDDMTGADLYSICSNAWLSAVRRTITIHQKAKDQSKEPIADDVVVKLSDFQAAIEIFVPSISKEDLAYFSQLKDNFSV